MSNIDIYNNPGTNTACPECGRNMAYIEWLRGVCFECNDSPAVDVL